MIFILLLVSTFDFALSQSQPACRSITIINASIVECLMGPGPLTQADAQSQCGVMGGTLKNDPSVGKITTFWSSFSYDPYNRTVIDKNGNNVILTLNTAVQTSPSSTDKCLTSNWANVSVLKYVQNSCDNLEPSICETNYDTNKYDGLYSMNTMCYDLSDINILTSFTYSCTKSAIMTPRSWLNGNNPRNLLSKIDFPSNGTWINIQVLSEATTDSIMIGWNVSQISYTWVGPLYLFDPTSLDTCFAFNQIPYIGDTTLIIYIEEVNCSVNLAQLCKSTPQSLLNTGLLTTETIPCIVGPLTFSFMKSYADGQYSIPTKTITSNLTVVHNPNAACLSVVKQTIPNNLGFSQVSCASATYTNIVCKSICSTVPNGNLSLTMSGGQQTCYTSYPVNRALNFWNALQFCKTNNANLLYIENELEMKLLSQMLPMNTITALRMSFSLNNINTANIIYFNTVPYSTMDLVTSFSYRSDLGNCYSLIMTNSSSPLNMLNQTSCSSLMDAICVQNMTLTSTVPRIISKYVNNQVLMYYVYQSTRPGLLFLNPSFCSGGVPLTTEYFITRTMLENSLSPTYWTGAVLTTPQGAIGFVNGTTGNVTSITNLLMFLSSEYYTNISIIFMSLSQKNFIVRQGYANANAIAIVPSVARSFDVFYESNYLNLSYQNNGTNAVDFLSNQILYQAIDGERFWINLFAKQLGNETPPNNVIYINNSVGPIGYLGNLNLSNVLYNCLSLTSSGQSNPQITEIPLIAYFVPANIKDLNYGACQSVQPILNSSFIEWTTINDVFYGFVNAQYTYDMISNICTQNNATLLNVSSTSIATSLLIRWSPSMVTNQSYVKIWVQQQFTYFPSNVTLYGVLSVKRFTNYATWVIQDYPCSTKKSYLCQSGSPSSGNLTYFISKYFYPCSSPNLFADFGSLLQVLDILINLQVQDVSLNYGKYYGTPVPGSVYITWLNTKYQATTIPFLFSFDPAQSNYYYMKKLNTTTGQNINYYTTQDNYSTNYIMCSTLYIQTTTVASTTLPSTSITPTVVSSPSSSSVATRVSVSTAVSSTTPSSSTYQSPTVAWTSTSTSASAGTGTGTETGTAKGTSMISSTPAPDTQLPSGGQQTSTQGPSSSSGQTGGTQGSASPGSQQASTQGSTSSGSQSASTQGSTSSGSQQASTQGSTSPGSKQASTQSSTSSTTVLLNLPIENLLNIKYEKTTSHNWYFTSSPPMISDNGSSSNFLTNSLQERWPGTQTAYFRTNASINYFTPVGVASLPSSLTFDAGLFQQDSSSLRFPTGGTCFQLYSLNTDHPYNQACLSQPENCEYGFSAALWIYFRSNVLQTRDYLLTSGPSGLQGFQFYFQMGQLSVTVTGRNNQWSASMPMTKYVGSWMIVGFSWIRFNGQIRLLVGDQFMTFNNTQTIHNLNLNPSKTMYLGCMNDLSGYSDPTTMANMSVAHVGLWLWPIRQKALLTGSYVYQMVKRSIVTVPTTTLPPPVVFDFTQIINELIGNNSDPNPFYNAADEYISVANMPSAAGLVNIDLSGRGGFQLNGPTSFLNVSALRTFANNCPTTIGSCTSGVSLSFWLLLPNTTATGQILHISDNLWISYMNQSIIIVVTNGPIVFGMSTTQVNVSIWQNLGLTIMPDKGKLQVYINGILDSSATAINTSVLTSRSYNISNGNFYIGGPSNNSLTGLEVNDIIIWRRFLFPSEAHRFVGYTKSQMNQLQGMTNYWTTDGYIHADSLYQICRRNISTYPVMLNFSLSSVLKPTAVNLVMERDPFHKSRGQSPTLEHKYTDYLFLARSKLLTTSYLDSDINWTGLCLTDPCQDYCRYSGITVSIWVKIMSVSLSKIQFYFNSGDMADYPASLDGRGISFFTNQQLFGVSLSTCTSDWNIIIDANRYKINEWMNIGMLWREDIGLKMLINGVDYGLINKVPDQIYKSQDLGFRAVIGRFDTDDQTLWRTMGFWEMSNFVFGEMSYLQQYITADQYASIMGFVNNVYYVDAYLLRQGSDLINPPIRDLLKAKRLNQSYNYEGTVEWDNLFGAVRVVYGRIPVMIDENHCPTNLFNCTAGFTFGGWFYLSYNFTSSLNKSYNLIIQGSQATSGFGVSISKNDSLYGWVQADALYSIMVLNSSFYANFNEWVFIGILWQRSVGITLVVNGREFFNSVTATNSPQALVDRRVFVGDSTANIGSRKNLLVYNIVYYNYTLNVVQLQKLLGIQYNQLLLLSKASFFWTVYGLYYSLIQSQVQMSSVTFTKNRFDIIGSAICTSGSDQSFFVLRSKSPHCLQNPDLCVSFVLIANINFSPLIFSGQTAGFILTVGNNVTGTKGVTILQTAANTTEFYVRNSTTTCKSVMSNYSFSSWVQLKLIWSSLKNPIVKVDENTKAAAMDAVCVRETNNVVPPSDITFGYNPSRASMGVPTCVSEVMVMNVLTAADPDAESSGLFSSSCYQGMDLYYPLNGQAIDQYQMPFGATQFVNVNISDVLPPSCLTDPSSCSNGLTLSLWVRVDSLASASVPLLTVGRPTRRGIGLSVYMTSNTSSFGVSANVHTGAALWTLMQDGALTVSQWTNIGVTWSPISGLTMFVNGLVAKSMTQSTLVAAQDPSLASGIVFGPGLTGVTDNLVVWFSVVASCQTPQASSKLLMGACKADPKVPVQAKCSVVSNCMNVSGALCLDQTPANIIQMANSGILLTSPSDASSILVLVNTVLKATPPINNLTLAAVTLLLNVATNMVTANPLTSPSAIILLSPFVNVTAELMQDKYQAAWTFVANQTANNPLTVIQAADGFYLRVCQQLTTLCAPVTVVQGVHGASIVQVDVRVVGCEVVKLPNYADPAWSQNETSTWANPGDSISLTKQRIVENGPLVSIVSSIYNALVVIPPQASLALSQNSQLTLGVNGKILTMTTSPPFPMTPNQTMLHVHLALVIKNQLATPNPAWSTSDPPNATMNFQWFPAFWNGFPTSPNSSFGSWDNTGCTPVNWNTTNVVFRCNHMTSFTVMMQPPGPNLNAYLMMVLSYLTTIGLAISILCLLIFIITILASKSLRGTRYIIHLNMSIALLIASIAFILVQPAKTNQVFCQAVGVLMHLFFLASFSWFFFEALFVFSAVTSGKLKGQLKYYVPLAWIMPVALVAAIAALNINAYGQNQFCWLSQNNLFLWSFLGPIIVLILMTVIVSLIVACNIRTAAVKGEGLFEVSDNIKQTAYTLPFVLLGWLFGILYFLTSSVVLAFLFGILCSLQGLWVLIFFGLMNIDFRMALCRRSREKDPRELESILKGIGTGSESEASLRGPGKHGPPPKASAPVYYTGNPRSRPPRHVDSVEASQTTINSERNLINQSYQNDDFLDEIDTNTIQNNGEPSNFRRTIPGTPYYQE